MAFVPLAIESAPVIATEGAALGTAALAEGSILATEGAVGINAASATATAAASGLINKSSQFRKFASTSLINTANSMKNNPIIEDTKTQLKNTVKETQSAVVNGIATGISTGIMNVANKAANLIAKPFSSNKTGGNYYRSNIQSKFIHGSSGRIYSDSMLSIIKNNITFIIVILILITMLLVYYFVFYKYKKVKYTKYSKNSLRNLVL